MQQDISTSLFRVSIPCLGILSWGKRFGLEKCLVSSAWHLCDTTTPDADAPRRHTESLLQPQPPEGGQTSSKYAESKNKPSPRVPWLLLCLTLKNPSASPTQLVPNGPCAQSSPVPQHPPTSSCNIGLLKPFGAGGEMTYLPSAQPLTAHGPKLCKGRTLDPQL